MNQKLQAPRGTQDIFGPQALTFRKINDVAFGIAAKYGYEEMMTPIFESTDVFHRTLGETSDMVSKETYTFTDRGGDSLTLRPEGTAGIARAFISNGMAQNLPLKIYYYGPMFRCERPQKGRYRQFHQIGVECLGLDSPMADVECILMARDFLNQLGLQDKVVLKINSLGDPESRQNHRSRLVEYLTPFSNELSADSQIRLNKNPLRILDSKDAQDQKIVKGAPSLSDCFNETSQQFFDQVLKGLQEVEVKYEIDPQLVRGIDYYTHTVFEFVTTELGAQGTVLAGGRYDGLIEMMGGPSTSGLGWGAGVERLSLLIGESLSKQSLKTAAIITTNSVSEIHALKLAHQLRNWGLHVETPIGGNIGKKMKKASRFEPDWAIILGESEMEQKIYTVKMMKTGEQTQIPWEKIESLIQPSI